MKQWKYNGTSILFKIMKTFAGMVCVLFPVKIELDFMIKYLNGVV